MEVFRAAPLWATKTTIGKHALIDGNQKVVEKLTESLGVPVLEATAWNYKCEMQKLLKKGHDFESIEVPIRKHGMPLLLPNEIDQLTKKFVENIHTCGSPVSSTIVLAAAKGIAIHKDCSLLHKHGELEKFKKSWAFSLTDMVMLSVKQLEPIKNFLVILIRLRVRFWTG